MAEVLEILRRMLILLCISVITQIVTFFVFLIAEFKKSPNTYKTKLVYTVKLLNIIESFLQFQRNQILNEETAESLSKQHNIYQSMIKFHFE
jgi:hypothetical protein